MSKAEKLIDLDGTNGDQGLLILPCACSHESECETDKLKQYLSTIYNHQNGKISTLYNNVRVIVEFNKKTSQLKTYADMIENNETALDKIKPIFLTSQSILNDIVSLYNTVIKIKKSFEYAVQVSNHAGILYNSLFIFEKYFDAKICEVTKEVLSVGFEDNFELSPICDPTIDNDEIKIIIQQVKDLNELVGPIFDKIEFYTNSSIEHRNSIAEKYRELESEHKESSEN